ncbi:MAG: heme ABC exporter ATP-binding protein CcmA [Firmicutes bacterium]|nr:heme ABC exporter ATP-binding protein CcmA [Bacillota bacterium]
MSAEIASVATAGPTRSQTVGVSLRLEQVSKRYGLLYALRDLSLQIRAGEFVLLLGPNGCGKTTLLRVAARLSQPTSGRVVLEGVASETTASMRTVGYVGHQTLLYDELTGAENLRFFARLYGIHSEPLLEEWLRAAELWLRRNDLVRTYSRGMRQRLSIARALLHDPGLILLDEPTTGLDQSGLAWLGGALARLKQQGKTIVASTHSREALAELATRCVTLAAGTVVSDTQSQHSAQQ